MILKKEPSNSLKNQNSSGHSYLEFEICLVFDAWDLGFRGFRARVQHV
jgi:hypothetical protein